MLYNFRRCIGRRITYCTLSVCLSVCFVRPCNSNIKSSRKFKSGKRVNLDRKVKVTQSAYHVCLFLAFSSSTQVFVSFGAVAQMSVQLARLVRRDLNSSVSDQATSRSQTRTAVDAPSKVNRSQKTYGPNGRYDVML